MKEVNWGIIGCGAVTEVKSGPAFERVRSSKLVAVMRRNKEKAEDYAKRQGVPKWYGDARELLDDPDVNVVYVATPPGSHAEYAVMAAKAGKHIYVEKPMALSYPQCREMIKAANKAGVSLFVAYYRRCLSYFLKVKELVESGAVGKPRLVNIRLFKPIPAKLLQSDELPWRFQPDISGGGLFVDLASHQLDYLDFLFGPIVTVKAFAANQSGDYPVEDIVCAGFTFKSGILGNGTWCFSVSGKGRTDQIEILGSKGKISFSTFDFTPIILESESKDETFDFSKPKHIQEPLIRTVVDALLRRGECPSTGESAARTTRIMETILEDYYKERSTITMG